MSSAEHRTDDPRSRNLISDEELSFSMPAPPTRREPKVEREERVEHVEPAPVPEPVERPMPREPEVAPPESLDFHPEEMPRLRPSAPPEGTERTGRLS